MEDKGKERGGDVRKDLQALPDFFIGQDIEEAIPHPFFPQETDKSTAEATLRCARCTFHKQHDRSGFDKLCKAVIEFFRWIFRRRRR